jgi:N-acetyl sugar amidotransferase
MRRCSRCLYDETIANITFNGHGVCNYCGIHDVMDAEYPTGEQGKRQLQIMSEEIRAAGKGKAFDIIVGVSGGCDSSYLLYLAKQLGLRPLAVHFDNTWDSTIAVENISTMLRHLEIPLETCVVDNKEYDDIYRSFLKSGVPDLEAPTDLGLATTLYRAAEKHGIRHIFEGHSFRTEGISPLSWLYFDGKYIESIQKQFGSYPLKTFPNLWLWDFVRWVAVRGIKKLRPLYYMNYVKADAIRLLTEKFEWRWYEGHHLENRFTAFYHSYFLPRRFGFDGRLLGFSALIRSGQISREQGLALIRDSAPFDPELVTMVKKRLGLTNEEFERLMNLPKRTYREFKTYKRTFERLRWFFWLLYKTNRVPKSFYLKYTAREPGAAGPR